MTRSSWIVGSCVVAAFAAGAGLLSRSSASGATETTSEAAAPAADGKRVVLLGFDGGSFDLATRFIAEGRMPWCKKLAESGTFLPLGSANPAESPVAWASVNTGQNPGKTNIFGFVRRTFHYVPSREDATRGDALVWPTIGYNRDVKVDWNGTKMPTYRNDLSVPNFWDLLDHAGVDSRVLQAACNFPAQAGPHTKLLTGLSTPDVRGGPGTFLVFCENDWEFNRPTNDGGEVTKIKVVCPKCKSKSFKYEKGCSKCDANATGAKPPSYVGYFETKLKGPKNFVEAAKWDEKVDDLKKKYLAAAPGSPEQQQLQKEFNIASNDRKNWEDAKGNATVPFSGFIDKAAKSVRFQLGGKEFTVAEGDWSQYVPLVFQIDAAFPVKATAHVHVAKCHVPEKDEAIDEVKVYLPAITAAADDPAPNFPVVAPREFGKELVGDVGYFDTIGWACQTHAVKDDEISEASFLSAIWDTIQWRRKMLATQLDKPDWKVLFEVFGETDRVCHMMYRFFDPKHPQFKQEDADRTAKFGPRVIKLSDAVPAVYEEVDKTIGVVMERLEKKSLGDCTLMVCSDHGFSSFREEVELNAWLIEQGFMTLAADPQTGKPSTQTGALSYVDWSKTQAYSVGIGTIYVNLKGREPDGIVPAQDVVVDGKVTVAGYDRVCNAILEKMRTYRNPNKASANDPRVFAGAWKRSTYLAGPFATDIRGDVTLPSGTVLKQQCTEGAADIQVGFNLGYRVGWGTAEGSRAKDVPVFNNKNKWSGDHTSVHPYLVRGIFFCSQKTAPESAPHLQDLAPTILALEGVPVPDDMDGHVIALPGLEKLAADHKGGTANRESLVAPEWLK